MSAASRGPLLTRPPAGVIHVAHPASMIAMTLPTNDQVTDALRAVIDPELRRSIVDLGMVRSIDVRESGKVEVVVSLTTPGCPIRSHFQQAVAANVAALDGVTEVGVGFDVLSDEEKGRLQEALGRPGGLPEGALAAVKNVICIASGKGGVGKSTMTANLAAALQAEGQTTGRARRRRLRLLDPAHAGRRPAARRQRRAQDHPPHRPGGDQGDVDRLLPRAQRCRRLARTDAAQGDPAVPRGRRLGGARLPASRPPARHR